MTLGMSDSFVAGSMITLDPYQEEAVHILLKEKRHLLADDYGVGKSYPAIEAAWQAAEFGPKLIVCPAYLIANWVRYIKEMYIHPEQAHILTTAGTQTSKIRAVNAEEVDWLIVSYTILAMARKPGNYSSLVRRNWKCVIFDEAHRLRGRNSHSTKMAYRLKTPFLFLLTADPIVRDAGDTFPLLRLVDPSNHRSYWRFVGHWCRMEITPWARKVGVLYDPDAFHAMLSQHMTRRLPHEVGLEFPAEKPTEIWVDMTSSIAKTYAKAKDSWRIEHEDLPKAKYILSGGALVHELRALTGFPPGKDNPKAKVVKEILADKANKHVAVYCWYKKSSNVLLAQVAKTRPKFLVTGSIPASKRDDIVQEWRKSGNGVMVATLGALTEGANLQFCNHVIFYEEDWLPKTMEQALGRFIRRNSDFDEVYTWYLRVAKSVDKGVWRVQSKRALHKMAALLEEIFEV